MSTALRRSANVDTSFVGDRAILYHRTSREAIVLNPTGSALWKMLDKPQTRENLTQGLCERFSGLENAQARGDVDAFVTDLSDRKLLETESAKA